MSSTLRFVYKYIWFIIYICTAVVVVDYFFFLFRFPSSFLVQRVSFGTFRSFPCLLFALMSILLFIYKLRCVYSVYFMYACNALKFIPVHFFSIIFRRFCTYTYARVSVCVCVLACSHRTCVFCILSFHTPVDNVDKIITNIDICF